MVEEATKGAEVVVMIHTTDRVNEDLTMEEDILHVVAVVAVLVEVEEAGAEAEAGVQAIIRLAEVEVEVEA